MAGGLGELLNMQVTGYLVVLFLSVVVWCFSLLKLLSHNKI